MQRFRLYVGPFTRQRRPEQAFTALRTLVGAAGTRYASLDLYAADHGSARRSAVRTLVDALPELASLLRPADVGAAAGPQVLATRWPPATSAAGEAPAVRALTADSVARLLAALPTSARQLELRIACHGVDWHDTGKPSTLPVRSRRPGPPDPFDTDFTRGPAAGLNWYGALGSQLWAMVDRGADDVRPALAARLAAAIPDFTDQDVAWLEADEEKRVAACRDKADAVIRSFSWSALPQPLACKGTFAKVLASGLRAAGWQPTHGTAAHTFAKRLSPDEQLTLLCMRTPNADTLNCTLVWSCAVAGHGIRLAWSRDGELMHSATSDAATAAQGFVAAAALVERELVPQLAGIYASSWDGQQTPL